MKVGFTGTRNQITVAQHHALCEWLKRQHDVTEFHHGCCVGADSEALDAVQSLTKIAVTHAHPPIKAGYLSHSALDESDVKHAHKGYLDRNRDIVDACDILLACPDGEEEVRSGTWYTIRYAKRSGKPVLVFKPDGEMERGD